MWDSNDLSHTPRLEIERKEGESLVFRAEFLISKDWYHQSQRLVL